MSQSRLRILIQKHEEGTLSDEEKACLRGLLANHLRDLEETCPACGRAIMVRHVLASSLPCPLCGVELIRWSADLSEHQLHEIDPARPQSEWLGEFVTGLAFSRSGALSEVRQALLVGISLLSRIVQHRDRLFCPWR
jgi:predicted RNA-binding Zn-ribbon protein involved in translation (DUF1610 family)